MSSHVEFLTRPPLDIAEGESWGKLVQIEGQSPKSKPPKGGYKRGPHVGSRSSLLHALQTWQYKTYPSSVTFRAGNNKDVGHRAACALLLLVLFHVLVLVPILLTPSSLPPPPLFYTPFCPSSLRFCFLTLFRIVRAPTDTSSYFDAIAYWQGSTNLFLFTGPSNRTHQPRHILRTD